MKQVIETYDDIMRGTLRFYSQGTIGVSLNSIRNKNICYKYCILESDGVYDEFNRISRKTYVNADYCAGDPIYVHPDARLSRDLIRKSGYNITRSPEKAEWIVIPKPNFDEFIDRTYNFACMSNTVLYLFTISADYNLEVPAEKIEDVKERLTGYLQNDNIEFLSDDLTLKKCVFFPKLEEYKNLAMDSDLQEKYVYDTNLKLQPNIEINVETLDVWKRLDDMNMLSRFICASNWKEYPFTLMIFLHAECWEIRYQSNKNIKMILKEINFDSTSNIDSSTLVSKKDYDLLISYIFHRLGRQTSEPTYINTNELRDFPSEYKQFLKTRSVIAPKSIDADETYGNIVAQK